MFAKSLIVLCIAAFSVTDAQISAWTDPSVLATPEGSFSAVTFPESETPGTTSHTFTATPATGDSISSYTLTTSGSPFSVDQTSGDLSLDSALDYEMAASYSLVVVAVDSNSDSATVTLPVTITDANDAPTFAETSYQACAVEGSTTGASVTTVTASDQDTGDTLSYSVVGGDTNNELVFSGAVLQVASGETLAATSTGTYTLTIHAIDDTSPFLTGTTTYTLSVESECSSATALVVSTMTILMALVVSLQ